jgi:hypothetical protein
MGLRAQEHETNQRSTKAGRATLCPLAQTALVSKVHVFKPAITFFAWSDTNTLIPAPHAGSSQPSVTN